MSDNLKEREAFAQYLADCAICEIVPDCGGAFAWAWRAALAQAQSLTAEPVGWWSKLYGFVFMHLQPHQFEIGSTLYLKDGTPAWRVESTCSKTALISMSGLPHGTVFYSSPPVQPTRQLTTRELADVTAPWADVWTDKSFGIANAAIAMFCEVNGIASGPVSQAKTVQPAGAQEPVAWANFAPGGHIRIWSKKPESAEWSGLELVPLYTDPQPAADELAECKAAYESQFRELHALKAQRDALLEELEALHECCMPDDLMRAQELRNKMKATGSRA